MFSRPVVFSLIVLSAATAGLASKVSINNFDAVGGTGSFNRQMQAVLQSQGFKARVEQRVGDQDLVRARLEDCNIAVRGETRPDLIPAFRRLTPDLPQLQILYLGRVSTDYPVLRFELRNYVERTLARLGWGTSYPIPILIAASPGCDLSAIRFGSQSLKLSH